MRASHFNRIIIGLVAVLQCFVPLIHAHASELHQPGQVHMHILDVSFDAGEGSAEHRIDAGHAHSPAIGAATEFKRDQPLVLTPVIWFALLLLLLAAARRPRLFFAAPAHAYSLSPRLRPPATAPPRPAI